MTEKLNIIYLGYAVDACLANNLSGVSVAGNKMQLGILGALKDYEDISLYPITVYPVAPYPVDKKVVFESKEIYLFDDLNSKRVAFINIPVIKTYLQQFMSYKAAKKTIQMNNLNKDNTLILTYNMYPQTGNPAKKLKRKFGFRIVSVFADAPIDIKNRNMIAGIIRNYFHKKTEGYIKICDNLIALNKRAVEIYAPEVDYIIVDGATDVSGSIEPVLKKERNVLYSGALEEYNGIREFIEAAHMCDDKSIFFDIYGGGTLEEYVIDSDRKNKNIRYFGKVDNKLMLQRQAEACFLINPRKINDKISQVTFPSKTFEYLTSGTPVITTPLTVYSEEYYDKMIFTGGDTANDLVKAINKAFDMTDEQLGNMTRNAFDFVVNKKNWTYQGSRIYEYLKKIAEE